MQKLPVVTPDDLSALLDRVAALEDALRPFAVYAAARERMPLRGMGDEVHTIHAGTEYEARITLGHCDAAASLLNKQGN